MSTPILTSPVVTGELIISLAPAVDDFGILAGGRAATMLPEIPAGAPVVIDIAGAIATDKQFGELLRHLRVAGEVHVRGTHPSGIREVTGLCRAGFRRHPVNRGGRDD